MTKGYNKAEYLDHFRWKQLPVYSQDRPCVFLSHKREDKPGCRIIAEYFKEAEIDYYLDELDEALQQAAAAQNAELITESLKKGIRESTHMMVVVSENTCKSQWVPFEVGYGHAAIIDKFLKQDQNGEKIRLSILTLIDLAEKELPDFMQAGYLIKGTKSLNEFIAKISKDSVDNMVTKNRILLGSRGVHPLDQVLNWRL